MLFRVGTTGFGSVGAEKTSNVVAPKCQKSFLFRLAFHRSYAARRSGFRPRLLTSPFDGNIEAFRKTGDYLRLQETV